MHRDLTSHILALIIDELGYEKCSRQATEFLEFLINNKSMESNKLAPLSVNAYTFALMTLCKTNEMAK
jgi:DNA replication protein DnaC